VDPKVIVSILIRVTYNHGMTPKEKDNLTSIFYLLMRDYVPTGTIAKLVQDLERCPGPHEYTSKHLAAYAAELIDRAVQTPQTATVDTGDLANEVKKLRAEVERIRNSLPVYNDGFQDP
jgi:hypothetical protein